MKFFNRLKKDSVKITILGILLIPSIASSAGWSIGSAPSGLTNLDLSAVLSKIIVWILGFIGLLGILFLVYGGIRYVTSAGNDSGTEEAKNIITYAIWGLLITASAYAIVKTVIALIG